MMIKLFILPFFVVFSLVMAQDADHLPLATRGSHHVGVQTLELTDSSRDRTLKVEVWYPTDENDEATFYDAMLGPTPTQLPGQAKRDAAPTTEKFPLIVVSHGQPGTRYQLAYLGEHLASRGFVVANIEHTNSTYQDTTDQDYLTSLIYRPEDILFVIDELPKVISNADNNNVGLIGYSYGGYSVVNAAGVPVDSEAFATYCQMTNNEAPCFALNSFGGLEQARGSSIQPDPRIKAIFVMAPYGEAWFGEKSLATLNVPFFVAAGDKDDVAVYDREGLEYFRTAGSEHKYLLTLEGAQHNPYAECPEAVRGIENCFDPVWEPDQAHDLIKHFASAFFGEFLQGNSEAGQYLKSDLPGLNQPAMPSITLEVGKQ
jgi:predicted dienelactone hydrolase